MSILKAGSKTNFKRKWPPFKKKNDSFLALEVRAFTVKSVAHLLKQKLMLLFEKSQLLLPVTPLKIGLLGRCVRCSERAYCYYTVL